jgi:hypothetical protein
MMAAIGFIALCILSAALILNGVGMLMFMAAWGIREKSSLFAALLILATGAAIAWLGIANAPFAISLTGA